VRSSHCAPWVNNGVVLARPFLLSLRFHISTCLMMIRCALWQFLIKQHFKLISNHTWTKKKVPQLSQSSLFFVKKKIHIKNVKNVLQAFAVHLNTRNKNKCPVRVNASPSHVVLLFFFILKGGLFFLQTNLRASIHKNLLWCASHYRMRSAFVSKKKKNYIHWSKSKNYYF